MPSISCAVPRDSAVCAGLAGAVLLAYLNAFSGTFQFDDYRVIVHSTETHSWSAWLGSLGSGYRPLLKLSYLLNWTLGGGVFGFHLFNLLVHGANAMLVYLLALQFSKQCDAARGYARSAEFIRPGANEFAPTGNMSGAALFAALLFAVHPVHSEAVTYLSGRSASLMTLFYLGALWAYARGAEQGRERFRWLSLALFTLAVLVKESAMLFPLALLVWEWTCRTPGREVAKRQWPYWALFALAAVLLLLHPKYWTLMWESVQLRSLHDSFLTQAYITVAQLGKLLWPAALNIDPDYAVVRQTATVLPQLALLLALLALAVRSRSTRPWLALGLAWPILHLLPLNTFFPRADIANERQLYWADWALLFALAVEVRERFRPRTALAALLVCMLAGMTLMRNTAYHSEVALWEDTVAKSPDKARAWNNLGFAYQTAGRGQEAVRAYCTAIRLNPGHVKAHNNLERLNGKCAQQGEFERKAQR